MDTRTKYEGGSTICVSKHCKLKINTVKPIYKGHSTEHENVALSAVALNMQVKIIFTIHKWEKWDSDLL